MKNVKTPLIWKSRKKEKRISDLKELLDILINIKQENIDSEIKQNLNNLINWLETEFPNKLVFTTHIKVESKEYTPQQVRERIIRDLKDMVNK
jgi:hypothetical protein